MTKSKRIGHGVCRLIVRRGDDTDMRRRHNLNFMELRDEVVYDMDSFR
jgi:hypothetical protein